MLPLGFATNVINSTILSVLTLSESVFKIFAFFIVENDSKKSRSKTFEF